MQAVDFARIAFRGDDATVSGSLIPDISARIKVRETVGLGSQGRRGLPGARLNVRETGKCRPLILFGSASAKMMRQSHDL